MDRADGRGQAAADDLVVGEGDLVAEQALVHLRCPERERAQRQQRNQGRREIDGRACVAHGPGRGTQWSSPRGGHAHRADDNIDAASSLVQGQVVSVGRGSRASG
jgi:hypothetical protein